jgi:two-component sensor histidine kinase
VLRPDGSPRWVEARGQAFFAGRGAQRRAVRLSGVVGDVTDRRTAEEQRELLSRELNHRVKNLFAIANSMVSLTARSAATAKEMGETLRGRLGALARAHDLVQPALQGGTTLGATFDRLIESLLSPHAGGARLVTGGPPVEVGPKAVTSLALVLHELATNAVKYGGLSGADGRLSVTWRVEGDSLAVEWRETGGPALDGPPLSTGFGTQLARKSVTGQLGGAVAYDWAAEGLVVGLSIPLASLAA